MPASRPRALVGCLLVSFVAALGLILSLAVGVGEVSAAKTVQQTTSTPAVQLLTNGGFEKGRLGWGVPASHTALRIVHRARSGDNAALLTTRRVARAVLTDRPDTTGAAADRELIARAWIRSSRPGQAGVLKVVERSTNGRVLGVTGTRFQLADRGWHRAHLRVTPRRPGSTLDLRLVAIALPPDQRFLVDNVALRVPPISTGTPTAQPTDPPTSPTTCTFSRRGIPSCGALMGAAYGGNTDPTEWETEIGRSLGVRRTYYSGAQVDYALRTAQTDLALGRLPWISFKLPYSWQEMAAGKGDAWARDLAVRLSRLDGPVWLAFHHEPEGDGDIAAWTTMQARLGPIVRGSAPNVAFTVIVTGWHQFYGDPRYALERIWPDTAVDIAGFDIYNAYGRLQDGKMNTHWTDFDKEFYQPIAAWAKQEGVSWALGETGYSDEAHQIDPAWVSRTYSEMRTRGGIAYTYFNSPLNSDASWHLSLKSKREAFNKVLAGTPRLDPAG